PALTLCLETSFRHAVDLGRRFRLPIRRLPALILELLTIRLVTLQQFAALRLLKARGLLRRDFVEPDRHEDAECCIAKADMVRRRKWLRLLQEQQPRTAEFTVDGQRLMFKSKYTTPILPRVLTPGR